MHYAVETENLTYRFSAEETILHEVAMQVPKGSIYGFLGPNGAGKTTTLKLLLGLLRKQQGSIRLLNHTFETHRIEILKQVGSLIESPSIYAQLTAAENLEALRRVYNCPPSRIEYVLQLVDLAHTGKKKAGQFSLGMKQRLSIAIALLHQPALLILDEPTNGLDPNGILEMRELLRRINQEQGITILVSSHLLAEIEKLVTHLGIISKGRMVFQGTLEELLQKQQQVSFVRFETADNVKTVQLATAHNIPACIENNGAVLQLTDRETIAMLNRELVASGINVYTIAAGKNDLESVFMNLTNT
jgi:ABC-type multidrug transport system ATPase subunit